MIEDEDGPGIIGSALIGGATGSLIALLAILGLYAHEDGRIRAYARKHGVSEDEARTAVLAEAFKRLDEFDQAKAEMKGAAAEFRVTLRELLFSLSPWHRIPMRRMTLRETWWALRHGRYQAEMNERWSELLAARAARDKAKRP